MNTIANIDSRRSIRKFTKDKISRDILDILLNSAIKSPSAKNRQPWKFTVCDDFYKDNIVKIMTKKLNELIKDNKNYGSLNKTIDAISESSHLILIENRFTKESLIDKYRMYTDIQSIGASIQNISLSANELGMGSLWICDIFYCDDKIKKLLNVENDIIAAIALGYPDENPKERPRLDKNINVKYLNYVVS